jgi:hypothetical protein
MGTHWEQQKMKNFPSPHPHPHPKNQRKKIKPFQAFHWMYEISISKRINWRHSSELEKERFVSIQIFKAYFYWILKHKREAHILNLHQT